MKQYLNRSSIGAIVAIILTTLAYLSSLTNSFVYDDFDYIIDNPIVKATETSFQEILTSSYPPHHPEQNLYRPVVTVSYLLDKTFWGISGNPGQDITYFHLSNLVFHLAVVLLLYFLILSLPPVKGARSREMIATLCATFYGVHPVTTEAVAWVSGRAEIISALFCLTALVLLVYAIRQGTRGFPFLFGSWVSFFFALLSKENALVLPIIAILIIFWLGMYEKVEWKKIWIAPAGLIILAFLYYSSRSSIFKGLPMQEQAYVGVVDSFTRILVACKVLVRYLWLIVFPYGQSVFHEVEVEKLISSFSLFILLGLSVTAVIYRKKAPWFLFGLIFFFVAILPVSNLLIPIGAVMAERFLYFPLVGVTLALAFCLGTAQKKVTGWIVLILGLVIIHHMIKTGLRNLDWKNDTTLWSAALKVYPGSFLTHAQYGFAEAANGKMPEAYQSLEKASILLAAQPPVFREKFGPKINRKMKEIVAGMSEKPDSTDLIKIHEIARAGKLAEAAILYAAYLDKNPASLSAYQAMIDCLMRLGAFKEAAYELQKLIRLTPKNGILYGKLGYCYGQMSKFSLARMNYRKALELNSSDSVSFANLGILEMRSGQYPLAIVYFREAVKLQPDNPDFLCNLAACEVALGRTDEAKAILRQLLAKNPTYQPAKEMIKSLKK